MPKEEKDLRIKLKHFKVLYNRMVVSLAKQMQQLGKLEASLSKQVKCDINTLMKLKNQSNLLEKGPWTSKHYYKNRMKKRLKRRKHRWSFELLI